MPFKTCGQCQKQVGPRTQTCTCGFSFSKESPSTEIKKQAVTTVVNAKKNEPQKPPQAVVSSTKFSIFKKIAVPAGACPIIPEGFKNGWPNGPASDESIANWAVNVSGLFQGRLTTEAICYYARQFWDINSAEYRERVLDLIVETLNPQSNQELG